MEKESTKQKILKESLKLFSIKGYEAVSVGEIAEKVGIKAPSLYKHYRSKQDIFKAILDKMTDGYKKQMESISISGFMGDKDANTFMNIGEDDLIQIGKGLFTYFLHDEYACNFRRMLNIEKYNNSDLAKLYSKQYIDDPLSYQGIIFSMFIKCSFMEECNNKVMALQFYGPVFLLLSLCDSHPEREDEALLMIEEHIKQFNKMYLRRNLL